MTSSDPKERLAARDALMEARRAGGQSPAGARLDRPPRLLPENRNAWKVFRACSSQLIVGGLGVVIGITHPNADKLRWCGVEPDEEPYVFETFVVLERLWVDAMNEGIKRK